MFLRVASSNDPSALLFPSVLSVGGVFSNKRLGVRGLLDEAAVTSVTEFDPAEFDMSSCSGLSALPC